MVSPAVALAPCHEIHRINGIGTAMANRVAYHLGGMADEVVVHDIDSYGALGLVTSGNSYSMNQSTQDAAAKNPHWVPAISTPTAASNGAHVGTQDRQGRLIR